MFLVMHLNLCHTRKFSQNVIKLILLHLYIETAKIRYDYKVIILAFMSHLRKFVLSLTNIFGTSKVVLFKRTLESILIL